MNAPQSTDLGSQQAYPHTLVKRDPWGNLDSVAASGLTKRELFAAMAMQGLAGPYSDGGNFHEQHVANGAVKLADALLAALDGVTK
jgi:hypothetical protein